MNYDLLKETINKTGRTLTFVAQELGIERASLYNKLEGKTEFKISEIRKITDLLNLSTDERDSIFFAD